MATPAKQAKPESKNGENADDQAGKILVIFWNRWYSIDEYARNYS